MRAPYDKYNFFSNFLVIFGVATTLLGVGTFFRAGGGSVLAPSDLFVSSAPQRRFQEVGTFCQIARDPVLKPSCIFRIFGAVTALSGGRNVLSDCPQSGFGSVLHFSYLCKGLILTTWHFSIFSKRNRIRRPPGSRRRNSRRSSPPGWKKPKQGFSRNWRAPWRAGRRSTPGCSTTSKRFSSRRTWAWRRP